MHNNYCTLEYCTPPDRRTVGVKLKFLRKELLYDIQNNAYIEGHVIGDEPENQHMQHTIVDIAEAGNVDRVTRMLNVAHAVATELLYPYTKTAVIAEDVDDKMEAPETYTIELQLPPNFSRTSVTLLSKWIHEYLVNRVLYDWLSIANPKAADNWLQKSEEAVDQINTIKNERTSAFQRRLTTPF